MKFITTGDLICPTEVQGWQSNLISSMPFQTCLHYNHKSKPLKEDDFNTLIWLSMSRKFVFGCNFNSKHREWNSGLTNLRGRSLGGHADNNYSISALDRSTYYPSGWYELLDVLNIFLHHASQNVVDVVTLDLGHNPILHTDSTLLSQVLHHTYKEVRLDKYR